MEKYAAFWYKCVNFQTISTRLAFKKIYGCFHILATVTSATMNTGVQIIVVVWIYDQEWDCCILGHHLLSSDILLLANLMSGKQHLIVVFSEHFLIISNCISFFVHHCSSSLPIYLLGGLCFSRGFVVFVIHFESNDSTVTKWHLEAILVHSPPTYNPSPLKSLISFFKSFSSLTFYVSMS